MLDCWSWALELNMTIPCDWQYQIEQQEEACFVEPWHPPQHFFIILQCSFPCTGYEYRCKIIRYPSHKAWVIPDKHWRKNWVWSVEKSHHHPMSHPATLRGIWRVPIMMIKFHHVILMVDIDVCWCTYIMMTMMPLLTYSWLSRVLTALKEEYAGQSVPRNSQDCKYCISMKLVQIVGWIIAIYLCYFSHLKKMALLCMTIW